MSNPSFGQALLSMIESDLATVGGQPLIMLLQTLQNAKGNILLQQAAIIQFIASAPTLGLTLEIDIEQQLLAMAIAKIQSVTAAKPA